MKNLPLPERGQPPSIHDDSPGHGQDVADLRAEIAKARAELEHERSRTDVLERRAELAEARLRELTSSTAWRAALLYYRVRDGFPLFRLAHRTAHRTARALKGRLKALALPRPAKPAALRASGTGGEHVGLTMGRRGRVSVVLPVYNQASLLAESVESVLSQTYRDLELIIVNDGSTDGVEAVLDRYADDPRVIVLTQPNQKLPSALNNGFAVATGEFFTWTSADNVMLPRQVEVLVRHLERHPEHAMVYSDYQAIDDRGAPLRDPTFRPQNQDARDPSRMRLPREVTVENFHARPDNFIGASFLYRADAARIVGPYAEDTFGGEDYDFWLRLHALFAIGHVDEVLYRYRVHENTLNARARELRIEEAVRRLLARDAERLARLGRELSWAVVGDCVPGGAGGRPADVLAYPLSRREDPALRPHAGRAETLRVCLVDAPLEDIEEETLEDADLLLTCDPVVQAHLAKTYPYRAFLLDPLRDATLLQRIAGYRLFEKLHGSTPRQPLARVYPVAEPLRIGLQADGLDHGGLEQVVADLARNLDPRRVRPTILVHAREPGAIGTRLRDEGFEVVTTGGDAAALVRAAAERGLQVVNLHYSLAGAAEYRARGVATVYTVHNAYIWFAERERAARAEALRDVSLAVAVSRPVERYFEARFRFDPRRVRVVPNGLDARGIADAPAASREALGLSADDFVFLNVGRFVRPKLQGVLVEALRRVSKEFPSARLLLAGTPADVEYAREVAEAIRAAGLADRVRIVPDAGRRQIAGLLQIADCFVLPSLIEGWSIAVMEAMHYGLPLVLSDVGSAQAVVREGGGGIVLPNPFARLTDLTPESQAAYARAYPERNLAALVGAMRDMIVHREAWRSRAAAGRARVADELHVQAMARAYEDAFLEAHRRYRKPPEP
jgi:glycosyltransferase involved in cell wall biosynthesis